MRYLILLSAFSAFCRGADPPKNSTGDVLCSVERYVTVGLEFEACQNGVLDSFKQGKNPCPMLKSTVLACASTVKVTSYTVLSLEKSNSRKFYILKNEPNGTMFSIIRKYILYHCEKNCSFSIADW